MMCTLLLAGIQAPLVPRDLVMHLTSIGAGVLAISVGVFAFIPVIIDLSLMRTTSADVALLRARRAYGAFDLLLASVVLLGAAVLSGLSLLYVDWPWLYATQVLTLALGILALLTGTVVLGIILRLAREGN